MHSQEEEKNMSTSNYKIKNINSMTQTFAHMKEFALTLVFNTTKLHVITILKEYSYNQTPSIKHS